MTIRPVLALAALLLAACVDPNTQAVAARPDSVSAAEQEMARSYLGELTRDPEAARVRNLTAFDLSNGDRVICGEFNGKNAFGGYVGYSPFYMRLRGSTVMATQFGEDMAAIVTRVCTEAQAGSLMIQPD